MDYIIKFDNREKELIKILEEKGYNMILENLDIGDIQFLDLTTKDIIIVIERKTWTDLAASFRDGRKENIHKLQQYREQTGAKIAYLIEGKAFPSKSLTLIPICSN